MTTFTRPTGVVEPNRDRWGRPLIMQPDGTEIAYTRVSTLAKCIDDTTNLTKWKMRQVARGIGMRDDLYALSKALDPDRDKKKLNDLCEQALEAAGSSTAANNGTALHAFLEWADTPGMNLAEWINRVPADLRKHVLNYVGVRDRERLQAMSQEKFVVNDELQAAGTFDRIYYHPDHGLVVGDIKTGETAADYPHNIAMQVAVYAHSAVYVAQTGQRNPLPVNLEVGVLIHLNQVTGECKVHALDIAAGWEAARLATQVNAWRKRKGLIKEWSA